MLKTKTVKQQSEMQINSIQHFHSYGKARRMEGKHYIQFRKQVTLQKYDGLCYGASFSFQ
jgi:hypothetical protein